MAKWEDETSGYGEDAVVKSSRIRFGYFRLSVHRHIHFPRIVWFASSPYLLECRELASRDLNEAKVQAKAILQCILQDAVDEMAKPSNQ